MCVLQFNWVKDNNIRGVIIKISVERSRVAPLHSHVGPFSRCNCKKSQKEFFLMMLKRSHPLHSKSSWMNLGKTRLPWQNNRCWCFFLHHRRFNMANLAEINPNFYFLPPLWYPDFSFSRNQQASDGWKSNICSINFEFFIRTQSYLWPEQDNRQEHRHYQENERGEMIVEPWRERGLRAPVMESR